MYLLRLEPNNFSDQSDSYIAPAARKLFNEARWIAWRKKLIALLSHQPRQLCKLADLPPAGGQYYLGLKSVPLDQIRGSVGKSNDFDTEFYPLRERSAERWGRVATISMYGKPLPPVELIQVGEIYYVVDGHHRISVARAQRNTYVDAIVIVWDIKDPDLCVA